jgi:transposase-like protein
MQTSIARVRSEVRQLARGKAPRAVRYPVAVRDAAVALARPRVREGDSVRQVAQALGVSEPTLARWLQSLAPAVLRPVAMTAPEPEPAPAEHHEVVLITAQGVRVEGLDRDAVIAVLRALA